MDTGVINGPITKLLITIIYINNFEINLQKYFKNRWKLWNTISPSKQLEHEITWRVFYYSFIKKYKMFVFEHLSLNWLAVTLVGVGA